MRKNSLTLVFMFFYVLSFTQDQEELVKEGNRLFNTGKYKEAKAKYQLVLNDRKNDASILYNIGNTEFRLQNYQEAIRVYLDALKLKPNEYLQRNLFYHLGNTQQGMAFSLMQEKPKEGFKLPDVLPFLESLQFPINDRKQIELANRLLTELKATIHKNDKSEFLKVYSSFKSILSNYKDAQLQLTLKNIDTLIENDAEKSTDKEKEAETKIARVRQAIASYEDSFANYNKSLEICRKIAVKEGRDAVEVGNYIKNNWAIARERWGLLQEVLNNLLRQNLKLKDGVAELMQAQAVLYQNLEQAYLASQMQEILDYTLKVLAEFHIDRREDIRNLQKIAEEDLNKKKTDLESLKATQKQAQQGKDAEKLDYSKQEKEIANAQRVFDGLRNVEGIENFIEEALKQSNLFEARRYSFQMLFFLKSLSDFLNQGSPIERTFKDIDELLTTIETLAKEADAEATNSGDLGDQIANVKTKKLKLASEKLIDVGYMDEQLVGYLQDYVKEGSLSHKGNGEQTPTQKWLLETLNEYVKSVIGRLIEGIQASVVQCKNLQESILKEKENRDSLLAFKQNQQKQYLDFKNTLVGFVEGVQIGIDSLSAWKQEEELSSDTKIYLSSLNDKMLFLLKAIEKEGSPEELKANLALLKQKQQGYADKLKSLLDATKKKEFWQEYTKAAKKELSFFMFLIDPMKTLNFQFSNLSKVNEEMSQTADMVVAKKGVFLESISDIQDYFNILLQSLDQSAKEGITKKPSDESNKNQEEIIGNIKKAQSYLNQFEKSIQVIEPLASTHFDVYSSLHKLYTIGLMEAGSRYQGLPNKAVDTLKMSVQMQSAQKTFVSSTVDNRWQEFLTNDAVDYSIKYQQDIIEMIGVRGINQVLQMKQDSEKPQPQQQGGTPSSGAEKPDFDKALKYMKDSLSEGDKIVSFYEAKEFSNSLPKHDVVIDLLQKAIDILEEKKSKNDKEEQQQNGENEQQEKNEQQNQQSEQAADQNQKQGDSKQKERKPLELTSEEARQLLNDLNKNDDNQTKKDDKKKPINTPRPW